MKLDPQQIEQLKLLSEKNILVVGDVMLDHYLIGDSNRISPEAPVPIVDVKKEEHKLGGAANVALNLKKLGANVHLIGLVGDDKNGAIFRKKLAVNDIENHNIILTRGRPTTCKSRIISFGKQLLRVDNEDKTEISNQLAKSILERIELSLNTYTFDAIVLQDYNKGLLNEFLISEIIAIAKTKDVKVFVDPKKANFFSYQDCFLFKPNLKEIKEALKMEINPLKINDLNKASDQLFTKLNCENLVITLSENGIYFRNKNENSGAIIKQQKIDVADVCGAGDTVISTLACAFAVNFNLKQAVEIANLAAAKVCMVSMVEPISLDLLIE